MYMHDHIWLLLVMLINEYRYIATASTSYIFTIILILGNCKHYILQNCTQLCTDYRVLLLLQVCTTSQASATTWPPSQKLPTAGGARLGSTLRMPLETWSCLSTTGMWTLHAGACTRWAGRGRSMLSYLISCLLKN